MISKTEMEKIRKILRKAEVKKPVKKPVKKVTKTKSNVIRDAYGWPLKKGMIVIDEKGGRFYDDVAKVIRFDGNHVIVEGKDYESRRKKRLLESPGDFSRPDKQINTHSGTRRYAKGYEDNPSKLRIVHRSPNGGRVWRDGEWG
jgi:hypothetical protein